MINSLLEELSHMGDQDEDRDVQPQLDDILVFDEKDLGGYASEVMRLRASKSEPARESGIGLESVQLRKESKGLLWPSTVNAFEQKT